MQVKKENSLLGKPALKWTAGALTAALMTAGLVSCGGGGGSGSSAAPGISLAESAVQITPDVANLDRYRLTQADVVELLERGVAAARARGVDGTIAIVDRVGNVVAVYETDGSMNGLPSECSGIQLTNPAFFTSGEILISGGRNTVTSGLDNKRPCFDRGLYAIAKAVTGAYLSSSGNAFSTRTASFIVQERLPIVSSNESGNLEAVSGPLFGVQFSQLPCGDLVRDFSEGTKGHKRSPLGLSADPGGFPIYKNGIVVGGIGFMSRNGTYGLDRDPTNRDDDDEEFVAMTALNPSSNTFARLPNNNYRAPEGIRGERISAGGPFFRYSDTEGTNVTLDPTSNSLSAGNYRSVSGYYVANVLDETSTVPIAQAYGATGSGYRRLQNSDLGMGPAGRTTIEEITTRLIQKGAYVLTRDDVNESNRYPPLASTNGLPGQELAPADIALLLENAYNIAARGRAQIRTPLGSAIQVTISVVDRNGEPLGIIRTPDAPVFGTDVSLQKARSAVFMSKDISPTLDAIQTTRNADPAARAFLPDLSLYRDVTGFTTISRFDDSTAFSARSFGNFARPYYPDGRPDRPRGPFSRNFDDWSPFSTGLQLDMALEKIATSLTALGVSRSRSCMPDPATLIPNTVQSLPARNGLQIFAGGFPIYRNGTMIGGIGISGDGIDQDDMIAFLGVHNAAMAGANIAHPAISQRAPERAVSDGNSARYVNCPNRPYNDSNDENVCRNL